MQHQIVPIPCKPYSLNWLPERLIVSQALTLYTTPVIYLFMDSLRMRFRRQPDAGPLPGSEAGDTL